MLFSDWHSYDHYGLAFVAFFGTLAAVFLIQWVMMRSRWAGWMQSLQGVAPPFMNALGVLFGLVLAFLANDTWSAHDRAMSAVYREADGLRSIGALAVTLPEPLGSELRAAAAGYARASAAEWTELARRREAPEVLARADALLALLAAPAVAEAAGPNVQALLLRKASDIRADHDLRVALSQTHVNPLKWLGMAFLGFLTLVSVAMAHLERPRAAFAAVVVFALAAAPTAAIVLIQGNPFQQPSSVTAAPIAAVAKALERPAAP